jgi:hypothetical protein
MGQLDPDYPKRATALLAAEKRSEAARAWWRRVLFEKPKLSTARGPAFEIEEASARREMIEADALLLQLQDLRGP